MKRIFIIFLFSLSVQFVFAQNAKAVLDQAKKRYSDLKSFEIKFTAKMQNMQNGSTDQFDGSVIVKGDKYHLKVKGQEVINNGKTVWTYLVDDAEVNISDYEPEEDEVTPSQIYSLYEKGFKYTIEQANVTLYGGTYDKVMLSPEDRDKSYFKIYLYIKKNAGVNTGAIKVWEIYEKNGTVYTYTVTQLRKNPHEVTQNANYFTFDASKYPGVEVVDLR